MHAFSICVCIEGVGLRGGGKGKREGEGGGSWVEGCLFFLPSYFFSIF